ncbi:hypothetical protein DdX_19188 [Ditylenchus destructor]|uniref:Uncharacterized protein n=1 Tax=Ditylenchus destructor TaxID=166010 RepID=A0AAD4QXG8_9BILA|nr:hypothetical protein DdX_19188 [Ditylenchus destructor]
MDTVAAHSNYFRGRHFQCNQTLSHFAIRICGRDDVSALSYLCYASALSPSDCFRLLVLRVSDESSPHSVKAPFKALFKQTPFYQCIDRRYTLRFSLAAD